MHRIDGDGHVDNLFVEGNPATGQEATRVTADWLNAVQEEAAAVIEEAGLTLSKPNNAQLLAAIQALIAGAVSGLDSAPAPIRLTFMGEAGAVTNLISVLAAVDGHITEIGAKLGSGTSLSVTIKKNAGTVGTLTATTSYSSINSGLSNVDVYVHSVISVDTASPVGSPTDLMIQITFAPL